MGLDITAYEKLEFVRDRKDGDDWGEEDGLVFLYSNRDFADRFGALKEGLYRSTGEEDGFRAGSYSGYNEWRRQLARLVGHTDQDYWNGIVPQSAPFWGLINFADNEGIIDSAWSKRLAQEFEEWDEKARKVHDPYFYELYQQWHAAFKLASNGGAVAFH